MLFGFCYHPHTRKSAFDFANRIPGISARCESQHQHEARPHSLKRVSAGAYPAGAGRHRRTFHPTPRMSSYLVAFIVGNLTTIEQSVPGGLDPATRHLVRVWGTPDRCLFLLWECAVYIREGLIIYRTVILPFFAVSASRTKRYMTS